MKIGDPLDGDTKIGAIVSKVHYDKILHHIDLAREEGRKNSLRWKCSTTHRF